LSVYPILTDILSTYMYNKIINMFSIIYNYKITLTIIVMVNV